jgi:hypothetical protein
LAPSQSASNVADPTATGAGVVPNGDAYYTPQEEVKEDDTTVRRPLSRVITEESEGHADDHDHPDRHSEEGSSSSEAGGGKGGEGRGELEVVENPRFSSARYHPPMPAVTSVSAPSTPTKKGFSIRKKGGVGIPIDGSPEKPERERGGEKGFFGSIKGLFKHRDNQKDGGSVSSREGGGGGTGEKARTTSFFARRNPGLSKPGDDSSDSEPSGSNSDLAKGTVRGRGRGRVTQSDLGLRGVSYNASPSGSAGGGGGGKLRKRKDSGVGVPRDADGEKEKGKEKTKAKGKGKATANNYLTLTSTSNSHTTAHPNTNNNAHHFNSHSQGQQLKMKASPTLTLTPSSSTTAVPASKSQTQTKPTMKMKKKTGLGMTASDSHLPIPTTTTGNLGRSGSVLSAPPSPSDGRVRRASANSPRRSNSVQLPTRSNSAQLPARVVGVGAGMGGGGSQSLMSIVEATTRDNKGHKRGSRSMGGMELPKAPRRVTRDDLDSVFPTVLPPPSPPPPSLPHATAAVVGMELPKAPASVFAPIPTPTPVAPIPISTRANGTPASTGLKLTPPRPLKSALRGSRTPSPNPPVVGRRANMSVLVPRGEGELVMVSAPGSLFSGQLKKGREKEGQRNKGKGREEGTKERGEEKEDDEISLSSYETGLEDPYSSQDQASEEDRAPTPPPHDPPRSDISGTGTASTSSTQTPTTTAAAPARRKSVRVSLEPTFSPTPPAFDDDDSHSPWGDGGDWVRGRKWEGEGEERDIWEDSSEEDEEYRRARRMLARVGKPKKGKGKGGKEKKQ